VDELIAEGNRTIAPDKRLKIYGELQQIVMEDAPWIPLFTYAQVVGTRKTVKSVVMLPFEAMVAAPGLAIMIATTAFNLLGDGLRDALDVRLRTALTGPDRAARRGLVSWRWALARVAARATSRPATAGPADGLRGGVSSSSNEVRVTAMPGRGTHQRPSLGA
jgi:hypothetical protein